MNKSELRNIIKEEIHIALNEVSRTYEEFLNEADISRDIKNKLDNIRSDLSWHFFPHAYEAKLNIDRLEMRLEDNEALAKQVEKELDALLFG